MSDDKTETLTFNIETLTLGQVAFMEKYTGYNKAELIKLLEHPDTMPTAITIATIAIMKSPLDPAKGVFDAEQMKVVDL
jgi:hypothetical protein